MAAMAATLQQHATFGRVSPLPHHRDPSITNQVTPIRPATPQPATSHSLNTSTAQHPAGSTIHPGPKPETQSISLANATSCIALDLSDTNPEPTRFHARQVFRFSSPFSTATTTSTTTNGHGKQQKHQHLSQSERIPFHLELVCGIDTGENKDGKEEEEVYLVGSAAFTTTGWKKITSSAPVTPGEWHTADLVFERDVLALFLDEKVVGVVGFPGGAEGGGAKGGMGMALLDVDRTQLEAFLGGMLKGTRFLGEIAGFEVGTVIGEGLKGSLEAARREPAWAVTRKVEECRLDGEVELGCTVGGLRFEEEIQSWVQECEEGVVMHHAKIGTYALHGKIWERYRALEAVCKNVLGHLHGDHESIAGGQKARFQGGTIYWASASDEAIEVTRPILDAYETSGSMQRWGFPIGQQVYVGGGFAQPMQLGSFYLKDGSTHAYGVNKRILDSFVATGGIAKWGFPTSNDHINAFMLRLRREVHMGEFEHGSFFWSEATGAHAVQGPIRDLWRQLGGTGRNYVQALGLPTSDEMDIPGTHDGRISSFEQGVIIWCARMKFIKAIYPFKVSIGRLETVPPEGSEQKHNIYFTVILNENGETIFCRRYPESEAFGAANVIDVDVHLPCTLRPRLGAKFTLTVDVWDLVSQGMHIHLGSWVEDFHAANAWGMLDGRLEFESGAFKGIKNITAAVMPEVG